jgi:alpha-glucosidase
MLLAETKSSPLIWEHSRKLGTFPRFLGTKTLDHSWYRALNLKLMRTMLVICFLIAGHCLQAAGSHQLQSPNKQLQARVFLENGTIKYHVTAGKTVLIEPATLGIQFSNRIIGTGVKNLSIARQYLINEKQSSRLNTNETINHCKVYVIAIHGEQTTDTIEFRIFDNGCAFRYILARNDAQLQEERTTFRLPAASTVWYFERNSDWKLKSYAGLWQNTTVEKLPTISSQGPIQGKPLVVELPTKKYLVLTEAALYDYSGMRLKAIGNNTIQVNFTEGKTGFAVRGKQATPWRVILYANDLNALVNNKVIENLNPAPDTKLFAQTDYIQPGKSVWSWITRDEQYMQPASEKRFIDAASALQFEYTLLDEGWETQWPRKWEQLQELCTYAAQRKVKVWVWKHSKDIRDTTQRNHFLDSVRLAGAVGIKTDFMNSEAKDLIDFEIGLLEAAARRKLMVNFHGCHAPTGESKTYPNEMTREGIRGMELNIMKEPIPAWHNAALPFTRLLTGHGDYTPGFFSNKASTTYTHQLALLYLFNSPFQCIAENPARLLNEALYQPVLPLLKTLPVVWDETIVLPGSKIGELAAFARRSGKDWYVAVINGTDSTKSFTLQPSFLNKQQQYKAYRITDAPQDKGFVENEQSIDQKYSQQIDIPATGGMVIQIKSE